MYPYMAGETKEELQKAEDVLLEYIVHMAKTMKRTEGTVRSRLMAVRYFHVAEGCADPLKGKPRMWAALGGVKRLQGPEEKKLPVDVPMLEWIQKTCANDTMDRRVLYTAVVTCL